MTRGTEQGRLVFRRWGVVPVVAGFLLMTGITKTLSAQQLKPRAYSHPPPSARTSSA
jgi:hypothetical protein